MYVKKTLVFNCAEPYPPSNMTVVAGLINLTVDVYPSTYPNTIATNCTLQVYSSDGNQLFFDVTKPTNGNLSIQFNVANLSSFTKYELRAYMKSSTINSDPLKHIVETQPEGL
jgi:hypothetical protein